MEVLGVSSWNLLVPIVTSVLDAVVGNGNDVLILGCWAFISLGRTNKLLNNFVGESVGGTVSI